MTKYYVRLLNCADGPVGYNIGTKNQLLFRGDMGTYYVYMSEYFFSNTNNSYTITKVTDIGGGSFSHYPRNRVNDIHLETPIFKPGDNNLAIETSLYTNISTAWYQTYNWSNPNTQYASFVEELCNFFEAAKVVDFNIYGKDNNEINLYILKFDTNNFFPIFRKGCDSTHDTVIEV